MFKTMTLALVACMISFSAGARDLENILILQLKDGPVEIEMLPEKAPGHVARIKELVRQGFYDGTKFHRVIDGFMAQGGDPTGTGSGGSKLPDLKAEFNDMPHVRGAVSMARTSDPNSANSQFFIVLKDSNFLDNQYTVWGRVVKGMENVDKIKKANRFDQSGTVKEPDAIISAKIAADAEGAAPAGKAKAPAAATGS